VTDVPRNGDNYCYRHPDRQSFVLCQRCGRTICPECQTQAAVGVHCPECVRESRESAPRTKSAFVTRLRRNPDGRPVVTYSIIGLSLLVYLIQFVTGDQGSPVTSELTYYPVLTAAEPWRMLTAIFTHLSVLHVLLNMYTLFIFGPMLESSLGRIRFIALYLIAGFGGSVAVLLLAPDGGVAGASGAIFGLMGAFFVIQRRLGGGSTQVLVLIALNLAAGFFIGGISWQGHVGGLVAGVATAAIMVATRQRKQRVLQVTLLAALVVVLIAITAVLAIYFVPQYVRP